MTTEEKLQHFSDVSMETAKEEAEKIMSAYKATFDAELQQHKEEKKIACDQQFEAETENARREINKALSAEQLHIKRKLSRKQQELRERLFAEIYTMLQDFTKSEEYPAWLEDKVIQVLQIAGEDQVDISLSPEDQRFASMVETKTGQKPIFSDTSFIGGICAVIPKKNILIDYTLLSSFQNEKESFNFEGGLTHE